MIKSQRTVFFFSLALLFFFSMPIEAFEIGARALYWLPAFKTDIRVDDEVTGTTLNMKDTLGISNESFPTFEVFFGAGSHRLGLSYTPVNYSGSTTLVEPVIFNGKSYTGTVESELKFRMMDLEYQYYLIDLENFMAGFSLGPIIQIKYIDGEAKINSLSTGTGNGFAFRAPIPMVGLGLHVGILADILEARVKMTGLAYSGNHLYEGIADLSVTPFPFLDIHAGYKVIQLKIDRDDFLLDTEFSGPYIGLTVSF
jgi:hypothetical protein